MHFCPTPSRIVFSRGELRALLAFAATDSEHKACHCVQVDTVAPYRAYASDGHKLLLVDHGDIRRAKGNDKDWIRLSIRACQIAIEASRTGTDYIELFLQEPRVFRANGCKIPAQDPNVSTPPLISASCFPTYEELGGVGSCFDPALLSVLGAMDWIDDCGKDRPVSVSFSKGRLEPLFAQRMGEDDDEIWTAVIMPVLDDGIFLNGLRDDAAKRLAKRTPEETRTLLRGVGFR